MHQLLRVVYPPLEILMAFHTQSPNLVGFHFDIETSLTNFSHATTLDH